MREKVIALLAALGVNAPSDDALLGYVVEAVTGELLNATNLKTLPDGLIPVAVQRAAGRYLQMLKGTGKLTGLDFGGAVKEIQEGDTRVTYAIGAGDMTPEQRLDGLIAAMTGYGAEQMHQYRRLVW